MKPLVSSGKFFRRFILKYLPNSGQTPVFSETREKITPPTREIKPAQKPQNSFPKPKGSPSKPELTPSPSPEVQQCPYCLSKDVVKRGLREKKYEVQQRYLCNDSVTVAVEVPVYMDNLDIEHMQEELKFNIPIKLDKVLTGHIDILQLRNGCVHILDYKPQDKDRRRIKPVSLSRAGKGYLCERS